MHKNIVIIGAGAAGMSAATMLMENGFLNLTILEAENRIGGRIHTIEFGENVLDMGAQWFVAIFIRITLNLYKLIKQYKMRFRRFINILCVMRNVANQNFLLINL